MRDTDQSKEKYDLYRQLIEIQSNLVVKFDEQGNILYANPAYLHTVGKTQEKIIGKKIFVAFSKSETGKDQNIIRQLKSPPYVSEHREHTKTVNGWRWIHWRITGIPNENEEIDSYVGIGHDVTEQVEAKEFLAKSEKRYRKLFKTSPSGIVTIDTKGVVTSCNPAFLKLSGYEIEEIVGVQLLKFPTLIKQNLGFYTNLFKKALNGQNLQDVLFEWKHKNGEIRLALGNYSLIKENEKVVEVQIVVDDITEQRKYENELIKERNNVQQYLDVVESIILALDKDQKITLANRKCWEVLGYKREEEILGKKWCANFVPMEDQDLVSSVFNLIIEGKSHLVEYFENKIVTKDGEKRIIAWHNALLENKHGELIGILSSGVDITEKKKAEQAIKESEERFRQFSNLATEGILIHQQGICIDANDALTRSTGYSLEELIGMNMISTLIRPEYRDLVRKHIVENIQEPYEVEITDKEGQIVPIELHSKEIVWDGQKARIVNVQDISERKRAETAIVQLNKELEERVELRTEQLKEANKELEAFSYSVSHDLQAPLRAIRGFSEIIELDHNDDLPEEVRANLSRIKSATENMYQLISGLLDLSRLGRKTLVVEAVEIDPLAEAIYAELRAAEGDRQVDFTTTTHATIQGDREMISILLRNLIGNALKYSRRETEGVIKIECTRSEGEDVFCISDNGTGFNMAFSDKLFQPFQRLHSEPIFEGTGIGLSLCKRIVQHHNGKIWVESEEGKGAQFYFKLGNPILHE